MLGLLVAATLLAQDAPLSNNSVSINLPTDSPVALLGIPPARRAPPLGAPPWFWTSTSR